MMSPLAVWKSRKCLFDLADDETWATSHPKVLDKYDDWLQCLNPTHHSGSFNNLFTVSKFIEISSTVFRQQTDGV